MNMYQITYTTQDGQKMRLIAGVGLCEAVETFIDMWCPVISIDSVIRLRTISTTNKENRI